MELKFLLVICVVVLLNLFCKASVGKICDRVVEEKHELVLYYNISVFTFGLKWAVEINKTLINVGQCTHGHPKIPLRCQLSQLSLREDYEIGIVPSTSSQFTSYVKVFQVPRELTKIRCIPFIPFIAGSTCAITAVVRPNNIFCNSSLTNSGQIFQVTCSFLVYPKGTCSLKSQFGLPDAEHLQLQTTYSHRLLNGRPLYQTTCTIEGIVNIVLDTPFRVEIWPDVENGDNFSTLSDWVSLVNFVRPYNIFCNSSLTNSGQTFQVTCSFLVYPQGTCSLSSQFVLPNAEHLQLQTTYSHQLVNGEQLYQTTCTIEGIVHNVLYTPFKVETRPDLENGNTFSTLSDWISLDNFEHTLVFTINKLTSDIIVNKRQNVYLLCHVNNIPDLTLTLYKGDLSHVIYRSRVVNTLQYTMFMTSCHDSGVYICRADNHVVIEKRITVNLKPCGPDDTPSTYTIVVYTALPLCLIILIVIVTISVVCIRRKIKLRNALFEAQARRTGDINMPAYPSRTSRGCARGRGRSCHRSNRSRNSHVTSQSSYDVRYSADPPSYSSIFHTSSNNDVIPPADISAFYPLPPPYETVNTLLEGEPQRDVTQCNQENNKPGDSITDLPPPYPGI